MIKNLTKLYEGSNLSGATANVIYLPILEDCELNGVDVLTDEAVSGEGAVFSLTKNGAAISGAGATINVGQKIGSVTGLNVALEKGDEIVLNLVSGAVSSPVTLNLVADDGAAVPADGADGAPGSQIRYGNAAPEDELGINGDYYIDQSDYFRLYQKQSGSYVSVGFLRGQAGADGADGQGVAAGGTTGQILAKASGADHDTEWVDAPSAVSLPAWLINHIDNPPSSPDSMDDEFTGVSLDAKWTGHNLGAGVSSLSDGLAFFTNSLNQIQGYKQPIPNEACRFRAKIGAVGTVDGVIALFSTGGAHDGVRVIPPSSTRGEFSVGRITFLSNNTINSTSSAIGFNTGSSFVYVEVEKLANGNFICRASPDGIIWTVVSTSSTPTNTITHIGFGGRAANGQMYIDWFRRVA